MKKVEPTLGTRPKNLLYSASWTLIVDVLAGYGVKLLERKEIADRIVGALSECEPAFLRPDTENLDWRKVAVKMAEEIRSFREDYCNPVTNRLDIIEEFKQKVRESSKVKKNKVFSSSYSAEKDAFGKRWVMIEWDSCPYCGGDPEILTDSPSDEEFYEGDEVRCSECKMPGGVSLEGDDIAWINWHDDPDCDCEWCKAHPEED